MIASARSNNHREYQYPRSSSMMMTWFALSTPWSSAPARTASPRLEGAILGPLRFPRHPLVLARFGRRALQPAETLARSAFSGAPARALFAGIASHGMLPLDRRPSAAFGLVLGALAHVAGWVFPRGGTQRLSDALAAYLRSLGGDIVAGQPVRSLADLPTSRAVLCDLSPKPLLRIA